ncbi:NYN domain-containing protein [Arthrobacter sp. ok362]|nr:NYN domain-containing protein [Arthrobacter sp. ok362]
MFTSAAVALPLKKRVMRGRRLVLVDIENVVGGAVMLVEQAANAHVAIAEAVSLVGGEQVVIGTSHFGVMATGLGWRGPRILARSGRNGADMALLEVLTEEHVEERFDEVVLVSGDGIFSEAVAALGTAGVNVTVVALAGHCSKRLRMAASCTVFLNYGAAEVDGAA